MTFLRRKWQQKPKQWGPFSAVQSALFHNAENIGITPIDVALAMPLWEKAGVAHSYGINNQESILHDATWDKQGVLCDGDTEYLNNGPATVLPSVGTLFMSMDTHARAGSRRYYWAVNVFSKFSVLNNGSLHYVYFNGAQYSFSLEDPSSERHSIALSWDVGNAERKFSFDGKLKNTNTTSFSLPELSTSGDLTSGGLYDSVERSLYAEIGVNYLFDTVLTETQIASLSENPWQLWQPVPQKTIFLPLGSGLLSINSINQSQSIDNIDLIQQNILSINPINQPQSIDNITLSVGISLQINNVAQNQTTDILSFIQQNVLSINPINQNQTLENILLSLGISLQIDDISQPQNIDPVVLIQQNILNIDDTNQPQSLDNVLLSLGIVLSIGNSSQSQEIDNIVLDQQNILSVDPLNQSQTIENLILESGIILQIAKIIQNQTTGNLDLSQANIIAINDLIQSQIIDNLVFGQVVGKITITLTLSQPKIELELKQPSITLTRN